MTRSNRPSRSLAAEAAAGIHREPAGRQSAGAVTRHPGGRPRPVNDTRAAMSRRCSTQPAGPGLPPRAGVRSLRLCPASAAPPQLPPRTTAGRADVHWFREFVYSPPLSARLWPARQATGLHNRLIGYGTTGPVGRPGTGAQLPNRRFNDCRERVHIVRFCMLAAKGAKAFTAACSVDGVDGRRQQRRYLSKVAVESVEGSCRR
jgi:hypothetical protein